MSGEPPTEGGHHGFRGAEGTSERRVGERPVRANHEHDSRYPRSRHRARRSPTGRAPARRGKRDRRRRVPRGQTGRQVIGLDIAPVLIDRRASLRPSRASRSDFEVGDAEAMSYEDASFDILPSTSASCSRPTTGRSPGARPRDAARRPARSWLWTARDGHGRGVQDDAPVPAAPRARRGSPFAWGTSEHVPACSATSSSSTSRSTTRRSSSSPPRPTGSSSRRRTARPRQRPSRSTQIVARSSTGRGSTSSSSSREGDEIVHHREYLLTLGTRR